MIGLSMVADDIIDAGGIDDFVTMKTSRAGDKDGRRLDIGNTEVREIADDLFGSIKRKEVIELQAIRRAGNPHAMPFTLSASPSC